MRLGAALGTSDSLAHLGSNCLAVVLTALEFKLAKSMVMDDLEQAIVFLQSLKALGAMLIAMAHSLQLKVVAEGMETAGQLRYLRRQDCNQLQSYFFSLSVRTWRICCNAAMLRADKRLALHATIAPM